VRSVSRGGGVGVGSGERVESLSKGGVLTRLGRGCLLLACLLASRSGRRRSKRIPKVLLFYSHSPAHVIAR